MTTVPTRSRLTAAWAPAALSPAAQSPAVPDAARLLRALRSDGLPLDLAEHGAAHGRLPALTYAQLLAVTTDAALRGRGGGRFPFARKLSAVHDAAGRRHRPQLVVNAAESEPMSRKDAVLLARAPHLVLDGAALVAGALGLRAPGDVVVWLHAGDRAERTAVESALASRTDLRATVLEATPGYVAGEASAAAAGAAGRPARPRTTPPLVEHRGPSGRPTLVANAETLAHCALLARYGAPWFRALGPDDEPGTTLLTVTGAVRVPGVVEAAVGTTVADLVGTAGGATSGPSAYLVGGFAGAWLHPRDQHAAWSVQGLRPYGAAPGTGLLVVLPDDACPVVETARLTGWLAGESVGQCGPCRNGLPALAGASAALAAGGDGAAAPERLARWASMVDGRGACHHPDGVARLVSSLLRAFPDEVAAHAAGRPCGRQPTPTMAVPGRWLAP